MMIGMSIVVALFAILLTVTTAIAFCEAPRDIRDVLCFLAMLAVGVVIVLVLFIHGV